VAVLRYRAGIVTWKVGKLKELDRKSRKLLTMYKIFHPKSDVDRLYLGRHEGGRGLITVRRQLELKRIILDGILRILTIHCYKQ